jgi:DnaJ-domain-containing protein 1
MNRQIASLLNDTDNQLHLCVTFVLLWIAKADGEIHDQERRFIFEHTKANGAIPWSEITSIIDRRDIESFVLVCEVLRHALTDELKEALIALSIMVAIADNRLAISEIHILRLISDLVGYSSYQLKNAYREITGSEFPEPGDPSSIQWWKTKQQTSNNSAGGDGRRQQYGNSDDRKEQKSSRMSREEACVILGVQPSASTTEIRAAYKRLAQSHHPDRFASLGPEAAEAAHAMFVRIQEAHAVLKS